MHCKSSKGIPGKSDIHSLTTVPRHMVLIPKSALPWQYNFSEHLKFAEIIVGGDYKKYILDSDGTLFIDTLDAIGIYEVGGYAQVTNKLLKERLILSVSGRYNKNQDFKGRFTPRATALVKVAKDHNVRLSYQTAYRFPGTQQKYIRLSFADYQLLGGLPWILDYMNVTKHAVYEMTEAGPLQTPYEYKGFKPESVRSLERVQGCY